MADFQLSIPQLSCSQCTETIQVGESFFSTIKLEEAQILRKEFCVRCWEVTQNLGIFWKNYRKYVKEKPPPLNLELVWQLFVASRDTSPYLYYLLGLVLLRKKVLEFVQSISEEGQKYLILRSKKNGKILKVPDLVEKQKELEKIKQELESKIPDITF